MQKRKLPKAKKVTRFDDEQFPPAFIEDMMNDFVMEHTGSGQAAAQIGAGAMSSAIDLSKLVIENKVRNSDRIEDEDIYDIYNKAFKSILNAVNEPND